jgi:hypothetical protein
VRKRTILFLDDSERRHQEFQKIQYSFWACRTAEETIDRLKGSIDYWDVVLLDHDLGGAVYVNSGREDCGMEVVRYIVENTPLIGIVVIHSWNIPAAQRMKHELQQAGYVVVQEPFSKELVENTKKYMDTLITGYTHVNSRGRTYYLNVKTTILKSGKRQTIYFFSKDVRPEDWIPIPDGYRVEESKNGLPVLRRGPHV